MKRKITLVLAMLCVVTLNMATAAANVNAAAFAEGFATLRAEATKNIANRAYSKNYQVKSGGDESLKLSMQMKKGEQYILSISGQKGTKGNETIFVNNGIFTDAKGQEARLSAFNSRPIGEVKYKYARHTYLLKFNGKELEHAVQVPATGSIFIEADKDMNFECEMLLSGAAGAEMTVSIFKVPNAQKVNDLIAKYPVETKRYEGFAKVALPLLIYKADMELYGSVVEEVVKRLSKPEKMQEKLQRAMAMTEERSRVKGLVEIIIEASEAGDAQEKIEWINTTAAEQAIARMSKTRAFDKQKANELLKELKELTQSGFEGIYDPATTAEAVKQAKRAMECHKQIVLMNPSINFDEILVGRYNLPTISRSANAGQLGTPVNNWSNQTSARREGFDAEIGLFSNIKGEKMDYAQLYKPEWTTSLPDIRLNWDGNRVLFSMSEKDDHHWQVYEFDIAKRELTQVTNGSPEHLDFFDAAYLPSGDLVVVSNVGGQAVPCVSGTDQVGNIALYNPKTKAMRRMTFDQDANWNPVMMHNGKVMYSRWEYTDLMHYYSRFVMSMNPDGTEQKALFGSGMTFPNTSFDIQPLPDHASRFVGIVSGHHGVVRAGRLFMYDPAISRNTTAGLVHEFPYKDRELDPIVKDHLVDGVYPQFVKPMPIDNETVLVTAKLSPTSLWGLYLVDTDDNMVLIKEIEGEGMICATPLRTSKVPPIIPDKINMNDNTATVFIQDIYEGEGLPNVPRGTVKSLRVMTYEYAYNDSPSNHYAQGMESGWDIKTNLGTVPVEEDGSVIFKIPANTPISLQPLDSEGRAIQWMRSWFVGMPGENVACVGCHEDQNIIPMPKRTIASARAPHQIEAPKGGVRPYVFDLEVQPILDRTCISCHSEGKKLDFTGGKKNGAGFGTSAFALQRFVHRQGPEAAMKVMVPYEYHASVSPLIQILKNGHYGVELTDEEWQTLYNWIDFNVQEKGSFETRAYHCYDQYQHRIDLNKKYSNGVYVDWRQQTKDYADYLAAQPKPESIKPQFTAPKFKDVNIKEVEVKATNQTKVVEVAPGVEITFVKVPAGEFVMGENKVNSNAAPAHKAVVKKAFWMSTTELTNAQVRAILPEHNSRFYDQNWKDHVVEGYPANGDDQVAIRITWNDANDYCEKLSAATGLKIMLPTETQWEWAARGGTKSDYWYGDVNTNFATKENLSDQQMLKMAVIGVNPRPMTPGKDRWGGVSWYDYCTYAPKDERVDDGHMLPAPVGSYSANKFGLYDMLGNVSEWTRSDYFKYDEKVSKNATSEYKVVKGGAWNTHPKDARVATRKYFLPWQAPYNVGMRLVIEQ